MMPMMTKYILIYYIRIMNHGNDDAHDYNGKNWYIIERNDFLSSAVCAGKVIDEVDKAQQVLNF